MYNKLKGLMVEHHITQEKLAMELEVSKTTLNFKINGKSDFTITEAKIISKLLKKPMDEIFYINWKKLLIFNLIKS